MGLWIQLNESLMKPNLLVFHHVSVLHQVWVTRTLGSVWMIAPLKRISSGLMEWMSWVFFFFFIFISLNVHLLWGKSNSQTTHFQKSIYVSCPLVSDRVSRRCTRTGGRISRIISSRAERIVWWWSRERTANGTTCPATTIYPTSARKEQVRNYRSEVRDRDREDFNSVRMHETHQKWQERHW